MKVRAIVAAAVLGLPVTFSAVTAAPAQAVTASAPKFFPVVPFSGGCSVGPAAGPLHLPAWTMNVTGSHQLSLISGPGIARPYYRMTIKATVTTRYLKLIPWYTNVAGSVSMEGKTVAEDVFTHLSNMPRASYYSVIYLTNKPLLYGPIDYKIGASSSTNLETPVSCSTTITF